MQRDEFGKMGEVIRIRLPLHLETEVELKQTNYQEEIEEICLK